MIKTITVSGITPVDFSNGGAEPQYYLYGKYAWIKNKSDASVFVSAEPKCAPNADGTSEIFAGDCVMMNMPDTNTLYFSGTGDVEIHTGDIAVCPFKYSSEGGDDTSSGASASGGTSQNIDVSGLETRLDDHDIRIENNENTLARFGRIFSYKPAFSADEEHNPNAEIENFSVRRIGNTVGISGKLRKVLCSNSGAEIPIGTWSDIPLPLVQAGGIMSVWYTDGKEIDSTAAVYIKPDGQMAIAEAGNIPDGQEISVRFNCTYITGT